jgi:hypothetical protein
VHVRSVLRTAAAAGYVEIVETPVVRVRASRLLVDDFRIWTAHSIATTDLVSVLTQSL